MGTTSDDDTDIQSQNPRMAPQPVGADEVRDCCPSKGRCGSVTTTETRCDARKHSRDDTLDARGFDFRKYDQAKRTRISDILGPSPETKSSIPAAAGAQRTARQLFRRRPSRFAVEDLTPPARA